LILGPLIAIAMASSGSSRFQEKNPNAPPADKAQKLCAGVITRNQLANLTAYIINTKKEAPKTKQLLTIFG